MKIEGGASEGGWRGGRREREDDGLRQGTSESERRFRDIRRDLEALGRLLPDDQLLEIADSFHEILRDRRRWRRAPEARSFTAH